MKTVIHTAVDVTDEQRIKIANVEDGKLSKRRALKTECKDFIWARGADWEVALTDEWNQEFGEVEDLI